MPKTSKASTLKAGDQAPLFTLPNQKGEPRVPARPPSRRGPCSSVSTGARGDPTAVAGSATWPSIHPQYRDLGATVMAVVAQRSEKVKRYVEDTGLPFDILIDDTRDTVKAYGVWHRVGFDAWNIARPSLFLIDRARDHPLRVRGGPSDRVSRSTR